MTVQHNNDTAVSDLLESSSNTQGGTETTNMTTPKGSTNSNSAAASELKSRATGLGDGDNDSDGDDNGADADDDTSPLTAPERLLFDELKAMKQRLLELEQRATPTLNAKALEAEWELTALKRGAETEQEHCPCFTSFHQVHK